MWPYKGRCAGGERDGERERERGDSGRRGEKEGGRGRKGEEEGSEGKEREKMEGGREGGRGEKMEKGGEGREKDIPCNPSHKDHESMSLAVLNTCIIWTASSEFGTYRLCKQRRFSLASTSAARSYKQ